MSDTRRVQIVDAFTTEPTTGNPAGVVPEADRRLRYFTPETEVDLCGHATVAAFASLYERAVVAAGTYTVETGVGVLDVEITEDGTVWLTQSEPEISPADVSLASVADALGLDVAALSEVGADLPISRASTGFPFLVVPVSYFEQLSAVEPDLAAIEALCTETDTQGLYAFTFDALDAESTLHGRAFAPLAGIDEDPVTGTASGACGAYLDHFSAFSGGDTGGVPGSDAGNADAETPEELVFEQGHYVDRPGTVRVRAGETIHVGGEGTLALDGELTVPEIEADDILEA